MALLTVGVAWEHKVGDYKEQRCQVKTNQTQTTHGRLQSSYFRYSLDMIANAYQRAAFSIRDFKICLKILNRPLQKEILK